MITLPSQINNNKNNVFIKPIIMIEFFDIIYNIANRDFYLEVDSGSDGVITTGTPNFTSATGTFQTDGISSGDRLQLDGAIISGTFTVLAVSSETALTITENFDANDSSMNWTLDKHYNDKIKKNSNIRSDISIPQLMNQVGSVGNVSIQLTDYRSSLRSSLIGSSPDLTNSTIKIFIMLDVGDSSILESNRIQIALGKISTYNIQNNILKINIKNLRPALEALPKNLLPGESKKAEPLHYGRFNEDNSSLFFGDQGHHFFRCPLLIWDDDENIASYRIADHLMDDIPAASDVNDTFQGRQVQIYVVRDNKIVNVSAVAANTVFTNNADGATVDLDITIVGGWIWLPFTAEGGNNNHPNWTNVNDGSIVSSALVDNSNTWLEVKTANAQELKANELNGDTSDILVYVKFGNVTGTASFRMRITDGVTTSNSTIDINNANLYSLFTLPSGIDSLIEIDNWAFGIVQITGGEVCFVQHIWLVVKVQDLSSSDKFLYMEGRGREYSSNWDSRKTSGNVIENAPDVIESLLRDEWGFGNDDIDMDSFDSVFDFLFTTKSIAVTGSITEQVKGYTLLNDICKIHNLCLFYSLSDNKWKLFFPHKDVLGFTVSGTDTPDADDIFTDADTLTNSVYINHPIKKGSFKLKRSSENERYGKLVVNALQTHEGFTKSISVGSGKEYILNNWLLKGDTEHTNSRDLLDDWLLNQKYIASFQTWFSAIGYEVGDVINIRHDDLNDDMLNTTVNTQKWIIIDIRISWKLFTINISAIELF